MRIDDKEIYRLAREAGFTPNQAVTMTAIALAESGGDPSALNPTGEHSVGLWQINLEAHTNYDQNTGFDPLGNARMAYEVSRQGRDIGRWTVTHESKGARYLQYRERAQAAAVANGDTDATGNWNPPIDYHTPAVGADPTGSAEDIPASEEVSEGQAGGGLRTFLQAALAQEGDSYKFGARAPADVVDPDQFDCAELVQWAAAQAGVEVSTGSWLQYLELAEKGSVRSVNDALNTPGALVFKFSEEPVPGGGRPTVSHVAISLGDGENVIEARDAASGVGTFSTAGRGFTHAAVIPELGTELDGPIPTGPLPSAMLPDVVEVEEIFEYGQDSDGDGLVDSLEAYLGTDLFHPDTDLDGFPDVVELTSFGSDPLSYGDNPLSQAGEDGYSGDVIPETTKAIRERAEAAEEQNRLREEQLAEMEAEREKAAAEAEKAAAEAEAARVQAEAEREAEELRTAAIERQERQHQELVAAIQGEGFDLSPAQESGLLGAGLEPAERDSLVLAVREQRLEAWHADNAEWFELESEYRTDLDSLMTFLGLSDPV